MVNNDAPKLHDPEVRLLFRRMNKKRCATYLYSSLYTALSVASASGYESTGMVYDPNIHPTGRATCSTEVLPNRFRKSFSGR